MAGGGRRWQGGGRRVSQGGQRGDVTARKTAALYGTAWHHTKRHCTAQHLMEIPLAGSTCPMAALCTGLQAG